MMRRQTYLPFALPDLGTAEEEAVVRVLRSGWITTGPETAAFEEEFGRYVRASSAIAVNSCTAALHLALEAMGVGPGDEVITSPYTFASTAGVVRHLGATPVFADVERETLNLDPAAVESAISDRTKAIIAIHVAGGPADLDSLYTLASRYGLCLVEDCAHALPAWYGERPIGADVDRRMYPGIPAHASCFSFYATKTLTTGEGGMLCTGDTAIADRARIMALHGMSHDAWKRYSEAGSWQYEIVAPGFKYNLTDMAAALGRVQLTRLEEIWRRRCEIAALYTDGLAGQPQLETPHERADTTHAWHLYPLRLHLDRLAIDRATFVSELRSRQIGTSVHFIPLHIQPYYRDTYGYRPDHHPVAYGEYLREVSLPIYSRMTDQDVADVIGAVLDVVAKHRT